MRQAVALWHAGQAIGQQSLLVLGRCTADEASFELGDLGIPILQEEAVTAESAGIVQVDSLRRKISPLADRRAARSIQALISRFEPEVLHSHTSKAGWLGRKAGQRAAVPVLAHTFHGHVLRDYFPAVFSSILLRRERSLARITDLLFAVSDSCCDELVELGVAQEIESLLPAVDCRSFRADGRRAARELLAVGDQALLGFVGRLVPVKAPERFLDVLQAMPEARGVVFGSGPLEERCRAHPAAGRVRWMGSRSELGRYLPGLDVLVMPSIREGFPVAGVEAAACAVPTMGFAVPGVADLISAAGGRRAVPTEAGLPGLVAALGEMLELPPEQRAPARREELLSACQPERIATSLDARYREVLARPRPAQRSC
jgi:glycosyltransferase involved in cell wall biosynthesis